MAPWPSNWIARTLEMSGIDVTPATIKIMTSWKKSTPLPVYTNNPIGMPAGTSGAPGYLTTGYALFTSMTQFYSAFATFASSHAGKMLASAMTSDTPYSASWRVISSLGWPGSLTETDYPSVLLDLSSESYRQSVNAAPVSARKTSGQVGAMSASRTHAIDSARAVAQAVTSIGNAESAIRYLLARDKRNG